MFRITSRSQKKNNIKKKQCNTEIEEKALNKKGKNNIENYVTSCEASNRNITKQKKKNQLCEYYYTRTIVTIAS